MNKVSFTEEVGNKKHCLDLDLFFKEISWDESFYVLEDCCQDLLYRLLSPEFSSLPKS